MSKETTADLIHSHLVRTGMTEAELAELVGVDQTQISRWRRNSGVPRAAWTTALADTLDVSPAIIEKARAEAERVRKAHAENGSRSEAEMRRSMEAENRRLRALVKRLETRLYRYEDPKT